ncbi:erbin isoform X1 [Oncorhynchus mykiss]|uniref:Erbb2 interacting protein n=1 Tax=Oncorhynchus mykiss TaxID=8022 RepID=A0A8C7TE87_ONCMY|nr:erbin isoform X1 [Oncorhynchus mykiss]XP_036823482.1 erbin isoform X1 [Oncorhynchus mykiss]XP_036823483.1 erbin isoform X1 [Oncorhynchus mykiss]
MSSKRNLFVRLVPCRCLRGEEEAVTSLDYSHCSLETVPKEIFSLEKTLEELYLDANQIEELPKQLFNCQLLHRLSMPDNDLTVLPAAIANLVNLRELDVSKNSIQEFPENIKNCKVLAIVEASVNPISKLPEGFTQLLSLSQLYLNDAFLEFLPASFGRLTKLQILELRENQLKMLPKSMHKLTQLERLDLGSNEFTEVPEVLEQLTGIKELWMDGNRLTFLPGRLGTLKQLSYLDVSKNNLEMVDEQICGCESLQDLLLSNNALTQLPGSIGSLKKLTALKVDENQLMYLPDSVGGLAALDELDCSFNEIEALPSSIGQCVSIRTFAADHNFLTQLPPEMGSWKSATVLFLHSNKLESLPEEMGDMTKLKVINLSDNKLRNLPYSFTKLNQMTAMWLSENQSKPLIPLQKEEDQETHKTVLTNYMFPQQTRTEDYIPSSDSESFNPSLWEEQRKQRAQVAFECDEDKDERETPPREGNLKRYPTPYPDELKNMVKTAQSVAHRLKEDESGNESGKDARPSERNHVGVQDVGVKVIEAPCANGKPVEMEPKAPVCIQDSTAPLETSESYNSQKTSLRTSDNTRTMNHEDTLESFSLQDSEELSSEEEEMKMAEMRPPLIEITINQPKVVALSKNKKDDGKDADSLLDETVANSNQNNSNCSSPSRMSDSVSLTTDSSQDNSLCTPEREAKMPFLPKSRQEDVNMNQRKESTPLLQNGNGSATSLQALLKTQQGYESKPEKMVVDYDLSMERLAFIEKGNNNGMGDAYTKWDQINMNLAKLPPHPDNMVVQPDDRPNGSSAKEDFNHLPPPYNNDNSTAPITDHLKNGNQLGDHFNSHSSEGLAVSPMRVDSATSMVRTASAGVTASSNMSLSRSTEELSPEKRCSPPVVAKAQSITNIEAGGMKLYSLDAEGGSYEGGVVGRMAGAGPGAQGQSIVRSKSASLLNDQPFQVYSGSSASSSDLLSSSSKPPVSTGRYPVPSGMAMGPPPQYNVQYSSSTMPKDGLWTQRTPVLPDQGFLPPPQHSLANTNYSNRNQAPPYLLQAQQRGPPTGPTPGDMWAKERHLSLGGQPRSGTLQRQSSSSSSMGDPRRMQVPEGEYMTYRDIHTLGRGPLAVAQAMQRPLSARTYSIDGPSTPRPQSSRPQPHELPERTMSVSDFNYQHVSPSKRPNARVKSEHSLLDGPGGPGAGGRVPVDWRDQVMRHIEAKKMEKNALSRSYNSNCAPLSCSHYGSSRDVHHSGSQGSLVFSAAADGRPYGAQGHCDDVFGPQGQQGYTMDTLRQVPSLNGQLGGPVRGQMTSCQTPMARHPSREQLIDYLMLKVSHGQQPLGPPPPRADHDTLQQEFRVKVEKNPELGFSISGGVGGRGNPFRPDDNGIFVTRVQPEGPASKILQPGDKILQANGYSFVNVDHGNAVALLKTFPTTVDMIIVRELAA